MLNAIYFSSSSPSADRVRCSAPVAGLGEKAGLVVPPTSSGGEAEAEDVCIPLPTWGMRAGPRETIYFEPSLTRAASEGAGEWGVGGVWETWVGSVNPLHQDQTPGSPLIAVQS